MTPAAKCRRLATMLRAKAELERDPEIRVEWRCIARRYLILAIAHKALRRRVRKLASVAKDHNLTFVSAHQKTSDSRPFASS